MERRLALWVGLLMLRADPAGASSEECLTGQFTASGECCKTCNLGEGVVQPCGVNQTICEPCLDSVSYSDTVSATEPCKKCKECVGLQSMLAPCVESDNTVCKCIYGYYQDDRGVCKECTVCEVGFGLVFRCSENQNTFCEECPPGTYSDDANHVDPCFPCTICEENEIMIKDCTAESDAVCKEIHPRFLPTTTFPLEPNTDDADSEITEDYNPESSENPLPFTSEPTNGFGSTVASLATTVMGSSQPVVPSGTPDNLIPVYCSILAAVVVGLVAYIAFKRWNSCKQNKQGANNRPANQTPSPEGEKLHSDSGISVDSQSLHDQQPQTQTASMQGLKGDGNLYTSLPANKREEVEKLLNGSTEETWRHLAGELGYKEDHIDSFTQDEYPVRALLSDWSSKDSATMDALYSALRKIQRGDIVESLYSESTASSPV
ncbi:tumor necrosis factor receptor superfamily member 16 [Paroedura picta]|uniref:tumor necrosis factor receptor superfamily member 16 n=1 Tax=Paroedura picta TaxID=143630 RepID=UPI0040572852